MINSIINQMNTSRTIKSDISFSELTLLPLITDTDTLLSYLKSNAMTVLEKLLLIRTLLKQRLDDKNFAEDYSAVCTIIDGSTSSTSETVNILNKIIDKYKHCRLETR